MKKYIAVLLVLLVLSPVSLVNISAAAAAQQEHYVTLTPTDDTSIRANQADTNFGTLANLYIDVRSGSRRYGLIRFDGTEMRPEIDSASRIVFKFYTGQEERCKRTLLYGLYGAHKQFDENTLTWRIASGIQEGGVSLAEYLDNPFVTPVPPAEAKWHEIDVTDYVKSQADYIFAFKAFAGPGSSNSYALRSKEAQGFEPQLLIYTDIQHSVNAAADQLEAAYRLSALTGDVALPDSWGDCSVSWESEDESILSNSGKICERPPLAGGEDKTTIMNMKVSLGERTLTRRLTVCVLREGVWPAEADTYTGGGMDAAASFGGSAQLYCGQKELPEFDRKAFLKFSIPEGGLADAAKVFLRLYPDHGRRSLSGMFAAVGLSGEVKQAVHEDLTYETLAGLDLAEGVVTAGEFAGNAWVDLDVTEYVKAQADGIYAFRLDSEDEAVCFFSKDSDYAPRLISLDESCAPLYEAGAQVNLMGLDAVVADLQLPETSGGYAVEWTTDNDTLISSDGTVIRPAYEEGDRAVVLTARIYGGDMQAFYQFRAVVLKEDTSSGPLGFRELKDPMKLSDEAFFGVWDDERAKWTTTPILRYAQNNSLAETESFVKEGDYESAKNALLDYYRERPAYLHYNAAPSTRVSRDTALSADGIIGNQSSAAEFTVDSGLGWIEVDLTESGSVEPAYMLFDRDKNGAEAVFCSRESGFAPYLEVVADGKKLTLPCTADTYLQAGTHAQDNFGAGTLLFAKEEETPFGEETKRTYLNFDISAFTGNESISSIKLYLYGMKMGGTGEGMNLVVYKSPLLSYMDETAVTWNDHTPGTFNFSGEIYNWEAPYGSEFEWINLLARLGQNSSLTGYYLGTGESKYAWRALENVMNIYTYQPVGYPRDLDTAWRIPNLMKTMFGLIECELMTPEVFCAMVKYSYQLMQIMRTATAGTLNQRNAMEVSFLRLAAYFPELRETGDLDLAKSKVRTMLSDTVMYDDGSYKEATSGYMMGVLEELVEALEILQNIEGSVSDDMLEGARRLAVYYGNLMLPDGRMVAYGDGGRVNGRAALRGVTDFLDDPVIDFLANGTGETEPENKTKFYPTKKILMMRDGWHPDSLAAFINAETMGSHGHPDDLHLDLYAYGSSLLTDAGNGGGYNPSLPAGYVRTSTWAHNTVECDGLNQTAANAAGVSGMEVTTNETFDFVTAYTKATEGFVHTRKIMFVHGGYWLVTDILEPEDGGEHSYKQYWHPDNANHVTVDEETKTAKTRFAQGANLQIVQANPEPLTAEIDQSYIKNKNLVNLMEDYVSYEQVAEGTAVFNTLLYPTRQGDGREVSVSELALSDGAPRTGASALSIDLGTGEGIYYLSHEAAPQARSFGEFGYDGEMAYVETDGSGRLKTAALRNGSRLTQNGAVLAETQVPVIDLGIQWSDGEIRLETSQLLDQTVTVAAAAPVKQVLLNGAETRFLQENGVVTVYADEIRFSTAVSGTGKTAFCAESITKQIPLTVNGITRDVSVTIAAGTEISGPISWDGRIPFSAVEDGTLAVTFGGKNLPLSFSKPVVLSVPFYEAGGAYYIADGKTGRFGDGRASIQDIGQNSVIKASIGADFVLTVRRGAATTGGTGGGGGGGVPSGGNNPPAVATTPPPAEQSAAPSLSDIGGHWAEESICALAEQGVITGDEDGRFRPEDPVTRAEFVAVLMRAEKWESKPYTGSFTDVSAGAWYADVVETAKQNGVLQGYEDNTFRPEQAITREEMCKILVSVYERKTGREAEAALLDSFADSSSISGWARPSFGKAFALGIINGLSETFLAPKNDTTRAQTAVMVERFISLQGEK